MVRLLPTRAAAQHGNWTPPEWPETAVAFRSTLWRQRGVAGTTLVLPAARRGPLFAAEVDENGRPRSGRVAAPIVEWGAVVSSAVSGPQPPAVSPSSIADAFGARACP